MTKIQKTSQGQDRSIPTSETTTPLTQRPTTTPPPTQKNATGDGLLTFILIALGILGLYHVGSTYEQPSVYNTNISPSSKYNNVNYAIGGSPKKINVTQNTKAKKTFFNQLIISGKPETASKLAFTIDSYDKNVHYTIDLGNGDIIEPRQKTVNYKYPMSGSYLVELIATYKGQETILFSDFIDVYNSVELLSSVN